MQPASFLFFFLFAGIILVTYIALRRGVGRPALVSFLGVISSVIAMVLFSLSQGNGMLQALVVGVLVGGFFSVAALAIAAYFQGNEMREAARRAQTNRPLPASPAPEPETEAEDPALQALRAMSQEEE